MDTFLKIFIVGVVLLIGAVLLAMSVVGHPTQPVLSAMAVIL